MADAPAERPKRRRRMIILIAALLLVGIAISIYLAVRRLDRDISEAYALMNTNHLIAIYVCESGKWPNSWDELIEIAESEFPGSGGADIAHLRETVGVNWEVDLPALLATGRDDDRSDFTATYLLSGSDFQWKDPTEQIYGDVYARCGKDLGMQLE